LFAKPNIKSMRNLVDFALKSPFKEPPRLLNTSSMSTVSFAEAIPVVEDVVRGSPFARATSVSALPRSRPLATTLRQVRPVLELCSLGTDPMWQATASPS
jgi:hypothetical protein